MKKSKSLFGRLNNEVRRNSVDKATAFHRSLLREKALPQDACRPKLCDLCALGGNKNNCVYLCESVSNLSLFLSAFVAETQLVRRSLGEGGSIKNNKLCKTNPIFKKVKCL
jgi:hypothetical protein